jgi:hypothetical protein
MYVSTEGTLTPGQAEAAIRFDVSEGLRNYQRRRRRLAWIEAFRSSLDLNLIGKIEVRPTNTAYAPTQLTRPALTTAR